MSRTELHVHMQNSPVEQDISSLQHRVGEQTHTALPLLFTLHLRKRREGGRTTTRSKARERVRERERERERQRERQKQKEREEETERKAETEREAEREADRQTELRLYSIFDYFIYFILLY